MNYEDMTDCKINKEVYKTIGVITMTPVPDYCNNASYSWPIIVENRIGIRPVAVTKWVAKGQGDDSKDWYNRNPLRAAMIVFLMMKDKE